MWQTIRAGQPFQAILSNRKKNGELYYEDRIITPLKDSQGQVTHFISTGRDITERMRAQQALREQEAFNRSVLDSLTGHIAVLDRQGSILATNRAWDEFALANGVTRLETVGIGVNYLDICRTAINELEADQARRSLEGLQAVLDRRLPHFDIEYPCHTTAGDYWFLMRAVPLNSQTGGLVVAHINVTTLKRLERRLEAIYDLGQDLFFSHDWEQIIWQTLETAASLLNSSVASYGRVNEANHTLHNEYHLLQGERVRGGRPLPLDSEQGIGVRVVCNGQAMLLSQADRVSGYIPYLSLPCASELCVPMKVNGRVIDVLNVEHTQPNHFTPADQRLLQALADQAAIALENARLYGEVEQRARELAALNEAGEAVVSSLELETVLNRLMTEVRNLLEAEIACILLYDEQVDQLVFAAVAGRDSHLLLGMRLPLQKGVVGWVVRHKRSVMVSDVHHDERWYDGLDRVTGLTTGSLLAVPILSKGKALGVIEVISTAKDAFAPSQLAQLEALANFAAIAIEHAHLFQKELEQHRVIEAVQQASLSLTASLELPQVLDEIAGAAYKLINGRNLAIYLYEQGKLTYGTGMSLSGKIVHLEKPPRPNGLTYTVARQGDSLAIFDMHIHPLYADMPGGAQGAIVGLPLKVGKEVLGVMNVYRSEPGPFSASSLQALYLLADQAAIAIENARLYQAVREQHRRLQESQARLVQSEKLSALGRLTASIAHEINNPLQSVQGCLTLVQEEWHGQQRPEKFERYLGIVEKEIERISNIVRQMRDFYRPAGEQMSLIDIHQVLHSVLELSAKQLQHNEVVVNLNWGELPPIWANPDYLKQVFLNLLLNAIDAMPSGGCLYLHTGLLSPSDPGDKAMVMIAFEDNGMGMSAAVLNRLFEPFFTTKSHGSGLGLSISYNLIQAHGGQVAVQSKEGEGTTITIFLPIYPLHQ